MNFQPLCYRSDVVFEGRNKSYGAYVMRKLYEKRILTSALLAILLFAIAMIGPVLYNNLSAREGDESKEVRIKMTKLPPPPKVETPPPPVLPPPPPPPPQIETIRFLPPEPEKDDKVKKSEVPEKEELKDKQSGAVNLKGNTTEFTAKEEEPEKELPKTVELVQPEQIYTVVQQQAEFPGGQKAMAKFMERNYKQPKIVQRMGITGKVFVKFVVRKEGTIDDVQIFRGLANCPDCDAEALRLVKAMPKWKPAQQNGNSVNVYFTLPIVFKMNE